MATNQHTTRISAGEFRFRLLKQPGDMTRPVKQKIRAAMFDTLGHDLKGLHIADVYAGSGALGIEALSRGADSAIFVEKRPLAARLIESNGTSLGLKLKVEIVDAEKWLESIDQVFDIIFFDPPYDQFSLDVAELAVKKLSPQGVLVVSCGKRQELPEKLSVASIAKSRLYGSTRIAYYTKGK